MSTSPKKRSVATTPSSLSRVPPEMREFHPELIPREMRELKQWILWRAKWDEKGQRWSKIPYRTDGEGCASTTDPTTWSSFAKALAAQRQGNGDGIGFVFTKDDPFCGVDLDDCRDPVSGHVAPWARKIVKQLRSYTEISPSGKGLHVFLKTSSSLEACRKKKGKIECYQQGRYFCVTGALPKATPRWKVRWASKSLARLHARWFAPPPGDTPPPSPPVARGAPAGGKKGLAARKAPPLSDRSVLRLANRALNCDKFKRLYAGDTGGYDSASEADLALCSILTFYTDEEEQVDRLFRRSGLMRPKWDTKRGSMTYGGMTVKKAFEERTEFYEAPSDADPTCRGGLRTRTDAQQDELEWEPAGDLASDIVPRKLRWLWPHRIPSGKMTLLFGDADRGKSLVALDLAAIVSRGRRWPDGDPAHKRKPGGVVILSAEDDPEDTIVPRLKAAGADTQRIYLLRGTRSVDRSSELYFDLTHDLDALEKATKRVKPCRLIIIDPVTAYTGKTDTHICAQVRGLLAPLAALAARRRIAVLLITHMTKAAGLQALSRVMGSQAFGAAVRAAWLAVTDQNDPERRLFLPVKTNLAKKPDGLAYHIVATEVEGLGTQARIRWEAEAVEGITADEALAASRPGQPRMSEAKAWLQDALKDGPVESKVLEKEAKHEGLAWGTIRRAKKELDVQSQRTTGYGEKGGWKWVLQRPAAQLPERGGIAREGTLRGIRDFKGAHAKVRTHTPRMRNHQR